MVVKNLITYLMFQVICKSQLKVLKMFWIQNYEIYVVLRRNMLSTVIQYIHSIYHC